MYVYVCTYVCMHVCMHVCMYVDMKVIFKGHALDFHVNLVGEVRLLTPRGPKEGKPASWAPKTFRSGGLSAPPRKISKLSTTPLTSGLPKRSKALIWRPSLSLFCLPAELCVGVGLDSGITCYAEVSDYETSEAGAHHCERGCGPAQDVCFVHPYRRIVSRFTTTSQTRGYRLVWRGAKTGAQRLVTSRSCSLSPHL